MTVPMFDLKRKLERFDIEIKNSFDELIQSGNVVLGNQVSEFEKEFAQFIGSNFCVGVGNGTDAIEIALKALNLPLNSFVLTVANAGGYATTSILNTGLRPRYVDIDFQTGNAGLEQFLDADLSNVSAVIFTHLYGNPIEGIDELVNYFKRKSIRTIEDCAQAHGAQYSGRNVGTFAEISAFSFYPTKNLGCLGDGGAIVSSDSEIAVRARKLRTYGWSNKYEIELMNGRNSRLDELQAAVLRRFLPLLREDNQSREKIAGRYRNEIKSVGIQFLKVGKDCLSANHLFPVITENRKSLSVYLEKQGIASAIHYPVLDTEQEAFKALRATLEQSTLFAKNILSIPIFPEMSESEISLVIDSVNSFSGFS
jgi:dTDP-4-amino-4,6-dideoxygalactose transaminase